MAVVGRPNVGKSSLVNVLAQKKVSITSHVAQTTRSQVRALLERPGGQVVLVDTPGLHKPKRALGQRLNETALSALEGVDVIVMVTDATAPSGAGDRLVATKVAAATSAPGGPVAWAVVNKCDRASRAQVLSSLEAASALGVDFEQYYPVSARTRQGVAELADDLVERMPDGPPLYPDPKLVEPEEHRWVAELVREQLLALTREEVPHSIACRVTEWDWPRVRCEIVVERESQKPIVIGRSGQVLKKVGVAVRRQLPEGVYLELFVTVERDWQDRPEALSRLGF